MRKTLIALATTTILASPAFAAGHGGKNIVETAIEAGTFTTLVAAVQAAGLVETLTGEGPFTVFAPRRSLCSASRRHCRKPAVAGKS